MKHFGFAPLLAAAASYPLCGQAAPARALSTSDGQLTVTTLTGVYTGLVNAQYPNVREFRSIPYAMPPTGDRRWMPPVALSPSGRHAFSQRYPPSCPQYLTKVPSLWNSNITRFAIGVAGQSLLAGTQAQTSSEDCLSLAIWTPLANTTAAVTASSSGDSTSANSTLLPVAIFLPGGDFQAGGVDVAYQVPAPVVSRRGDLIVVTLNYRLNIFGFPNAAGLTDQNVGILDQRMAVEWLHSNIKAFGGDPQRMVLWGQSAGAVAVDINNYAFYENPLLAGYYMMSGTAAVAGHPADPTYSNFTFVASKLGCDFGVGADRDPVAELACMRQVPADLLSNFLGQYGENGTKPYAFFYPVPDERVYFANYSDRAARGLMAQRPALVSTTANEDSALYRYPAQNLTQGPYMPAVDAGTLSVFVCPAANTTRWRGALPGRPTYRYQYAGNFSSVTPFAWMGAYHASDIPMVFGMPDRRLADTRSTFEQQVAETMQDHFAAFVADPENGLRQRGWLPDNGSPQGGFMMRFAAGNVVQQRINSLDVDGACFSSSVSYDHSPQ